MKLFLLVLQLALVLCLAALLNPAVCRADTVYSTFGPGQSFDTNGGYLVGENQFPPPATQSIAVAFTPNGTFTLSQIDVAASAFGATTDNNEILVEFLSDSSGKPGSVLESWVLTNLPVEGTPFTPESVTATLPITVFSGTQYWVALLPDNGSNVWNENEAFPFQTISDSTDGGFNWQDPFSGQTPALDVQGIPVQATPEPSSLLLCGSGAIVLAWFGKRRLAL